jgi:hypothetical protein
MFHLDKDRTGSLLDDFERLSSRWMGIFEIRMFCAPSAIAERPWMPVWPVIGWRLILKYSSAGISEPVRWDTTPASSLAELLYFPRKVLARLVRPYADRSIFQCSMYTIRRGGRVNMNRGFRRRLSNRLEHSIVTERTDFQPIGDEIAWSIHPI